MLLYEMLRELKQTLRKSVPKSYCFCVPLLAESHPAVCISKFLHSSTAFLSKEESTDPLKSNNLLVPYSCLFSPLILKRSLALNQCPTRNQNILSVAHNFSNHQISPLSLLRLASTSHGWTSLFQTCSVLFCP